MQYDRDKLKTAVLYMCFKCDPSQLGAVKLHKVLYFSDMIRFAQTGTPITGATYRKRPLGPTCDQLLSTIRELEHAKALSVREVDYFGYLKKEFIAASEPDLTRLSREEITLLDEVIDFVCTQNTAKPISDYSHNRAWEQAEFGDELKYTSAFLLFPTEVSPEALEWASNEVQSINEAKSKEPLASKDFRTFRSEVLSRLGA